MASDTLQTIMRVAKKSEMEDEVITDHLLLAGKSLLSLMNALVEVSAISLEVHLKALSASDDAGGDYTLNVARGMDDLLFTESKPEFLEGSGPSSIDIYFLSPVTEMPLADAFAWAKDKGYKDIVSVERVRALEFSNQEGPTIAYFYSLCTQCFLVKWAPREDIVIITCFFATNRVNTIKPGQFLLVSK